MIVSFGDKGTQDIFDGYNSKYSRKKLDPSLHSVACRKLDIINNAYSLNDLKAPPGNKFEALKGNLNGWYSIRINDQFRIIFKWTAQGAVEVEIVDYH